MLLSFLEDSPSQKALVKACQFSLSTLCPSILTPDYTHRLYARAYNCAKKFFRDGWENFAGEQNTEEEKVPDKVYVQGTVFWEWTLCIWPDHRRR